MAHHRQAGKEEPSVNQHCDQDLQKGKWQEGEVKFVFHHVKIQVFFCPHLWHHKLWASLIALKGWVEKNTQIFLLPLHIILSFFGLSNRAVQCLGLNCVYKPGGEHSSPPAWAWALLSGQDNLSGETHSDGFCSDHGNHQHWQLVGLTDSRVTSGLSCIEAINSDCHDHDHYRYTDSTFLMSLGCTHQSQGEKHREEHSVAARLLKPWI